MRGVRVCNATEDYIKELDDICAKLSPANHAAAVALASVPDQIRDYAYVKEKSIAEGKVLHEQRLQAFHSSQPVRQPAASEQGRTCERCGRPWTRKRGRQAPGAEGARRKAEGHNWVASRGRYGVTD